MDPAEYSELLKRDVTKEYKKTDAKTVKKVTKGDKEIAKKLELEDRIFKTSERQAFLTLKDHKDNFINNNKTLQKVNLEKFQRKY